MQSKKGSQKDDARAQEPESRPASSNPLAEAARTCENAVLQYQFDLQRAQARMADILERLRTENDAELQRRWLEAYRSYAEALNDHYVTGPHVQEAAHAYQRLAEALRTLQDAQPSLRAQQEVAQQAAQRLAEVRNEPDAAERSRQVYADHLAQVASIWDRSGALEAAQRAQREYHEKLSTAMDTAGRLAAESQQRYLTEVAALLGDDTLWRRLRDELAPIQDEMTAALKRAQTQNIDATIEGLRAYKTQTVNAGAAG